MHHTHPEPYLHPLLAMPAGGGVVACLPMAQPLSQPTSQQSHALRSRTRGGPNWHEFGADSADSHRHAPQPSLLPPAAVPPVVEGCLHALPSAPDSHDTGEAQSPTRLALRPLARGLCRGGLSECLRPPANTPPTTIHRTHAPQITVFRLPALPCSSLTPITARTGPDTRGTPARRDRSRR